jgi:hypothetical protein
MYSSCMCEAFRLSVERVINTILFPFDFRKMINDAEHVLVYSV